MQGITEIICCVDRMAGHRPVVGMLIRYGDGHRACLGQYRLDWAASPMEAEASTPLRIGIAKTTAGFPYVARVDFQGCDDGPSLEWLHVPRSGRLEWWFSPRQCKICHYV